MTGFSSYFPENVRSAIPPEVVVRDLAAWNVAAPIIKQDGNLVPGNANNYVDQAICESWPQEIGRILLRPIFWSVGRDS